MSIKRPLSRRTFLRGTGQVAIALPFLEAMIPSFVYGQSTPQKRFVLLYYGSANGGEALTLPNTSGPIITAMPFANRSLEGVKQHISIISHLDLVQHYTGMAPPPGEATGAQHGKMESPMLSGMRSLPGNVSGFDNPYAFVRGTTSDQLAVPFVGAGSKFSSLQLRLQAADYNGVNKAPEAISVTKNGTTINALAPIISPLAIYSRLFSIFPPNPGPAVPNPPVSTLPLKKKSVLDLVLDDANRLTNSVSGQDKERLELHFENIRALERSLGSTGGSSGGGGTGSGTLGSCTLPSKPGADPMIDDYGFGGWANETLRGQQQVELIAHALQCGLTNVVSWALTYHQVWLNSQKTSGSTTIGPNAMKPDIHADSHFAGKNQVAANHNWAVNHFGMLVKRLSEMSDAHGTLLDNTFVTFVTAESISAHGRTNLIYYTAGCPDKLKPGVHVNANGAHPARLLTTGLQAIGMNINTLGEVTGNIPGLLK